MEKNKLEKAALDLVSGGYESDERKVDDRKRQIAALKFDGWTKEKFLDWMHNHGQSQEDIDLVDSLWDIP